MFTTAMVTKWLTMMMVVISEATPMVLLGVQRQAVRAFQSHTQHLTESHTIPELNKLTPKNEHNFNTHTARVTHSFWLG